MGGLAFKTGDNEYAVHDAERIKRFGLPQYGNKTVNPYGNVNKSYEIFPEAWGGGQGHPVRNNHIEAILIKTIKSTDRFIPTRFFPMRLSLDGSTKFSVHQLIFNNHILDRVPELGVPRMLTHRSNDWEVNIPRYGIAFFMEHGFAMTEPGKKQYDLSIQQMTNATWETIDGEAYAHMLNNSPTEGQVEAVWQHHGAPFGQNAHVNRIIEYECAYFGAMNRMANPMLALRKRADEMMARRSQPPDICIIPHASKALIGHHPSISKFTEVGADAARKANSTRDGNFAMVTEGLEVHESQLVQRYVNDNWDMPYDPLVRGRTIGEFFQMNHPCRNDGQPHDPAWSSITVHDNDSDQMAVVKLADAVKNCPFTRDIMIDLVNAVYKKTTGYKSNNAEAVTWQDFLHAINSESKCWSLEPADPASEDKAIAIMSRGHPDHTVVGTPDAEIRARLNELHQKRFVSPFNFIIMRPFQRWEMGSMIFALSGGRLGFTSIGQQNFQLSHDGIRKHLIGTFTLYVGVVIIDKNALFVFHNIKYGEYISGGGTRFYAPDRANEIGRINHQQSEALPSLLVAPIPNFEQISASAIDLTGFFTMGQLKDGVPHYSTAKSVKDFWKITGTAEAHFCDTSYNSRGGQRGMGSRMSQGHQLMYALGGGGAIPEGQQMIGRGHHGAHTYAGVKMDRMGMGPTGYVDPRNRYTSKVYTNF